MAKKAGAAAALPIMQKEAEDGNAINETELAPENPDAPIEVAPETAATPAKPAAEAAPAEGRKSPQTEVIPYERFKEVNDRKNAAEKEAAEYRERFARLDEGRKVLAQVENEARRTAEAARVQAQRPDPDVDPQGARIFDMAQELAALKQQVPQLQQNFQQTSQQMAADREQAQLAQWENNDVARVQAIHPDYVAARDYLAQKRIGHYMAMGHDQNAAMGLFNLERAAYVRQCATNGTSIAELAYQFAKDLGFQSPQANGNGAAQPTNGAAHANGAPTGQQRITQLQNGQKVQGLGGKIPAADTDGNSNVRGMDAQQFADWMAEKWPTEEDMLRDMNRDPAMRDLISWKYRQLDGALDARGQ